LPLLDSGANFGVAAVAHHTGEAGIESYPAAVVLLEFCPLCVPKLPSAVAGCRKMGPIAHEATEQDFAVVQGRQMA
jgi:hypothetical protein